MKKLSVLMIALIACFMIACSAVEFKVNFVVDGETIKTVSTSGTEVISIPENPTKEGYVFDGWYWDKDTWERPFTANSLLDVPLSSDMNVYCKWTLETIHVESITLNSTKLTLNIDDVETLTATTLPNNATDSSVIWSSSDSSIVSVENGKVIAHKVGTATITAITIDGGHTATCEVEVIVDMLLFKTLTVDDDKIYGTVSNSTLTFSFLKEITEMGEATYTVYKEITCESPIVGKTIPLNEGENKVYILQTIGKKIALFEVTIYRLPMHEVSFDSIGGTSIPSQMIEEGSKITAPSEAPVRTGYTFAGWDFDFETAIMEPTTIKAKWTPNNNTVMFNSNGGSGTMSSLTIATDSSANLTTNNFTKAGYTFVGWSTSENGAVEYTDGATYTMGTNSSYTLYVVWEANQNTVIFNSNSGSGTMSSQAIATDSSASLTANSFTKAGYTFVGWSTSENGAVEYTDGAIYTMGTNSSYTLYAVWGANQNTVIFNSNGGSGTMSSQAIAADSSAKLTANRFTKAGYSFVGWSTSKNGAVEYTDGAIYTMGTNSSYTLYAVWEANQNTVMFNSNGGSGTMSNISVATGSSVVLTANSFTREGYRFKGWATSEDGSVRYTDSATYMMGTNSSYTLYAVWEANKNIVRFNSNGGSGTMSNLTIATDSSASLTVNRFTKTGYTFVGWSTSINGAVEYTDGAIYTMGTNSSYTLYAVWEANQNTVMFNSNGGSGTMSSITATTNSSVVLTANSFTRAGYTFKGWSTSESGSVRYRDGATYTMGTNSSYTLYAVWEPNKNTLVFNKNGGSGTMSSITATTNSSVVLTANSFTRAGYTFKGWSTSENGAVEYTDGATYTMGTNSTYTLYAVWEINVYSIMYELNEGINDIGNPSTFTINDLPLVLSSPTLKDCEFLGWYLQNGTTKITQINSVGNITLYAKWHGLKFTEYNNYAEVNGYIGDVSSVEVPSTYNGKPVTSITDFAFKNCTSLISIEIPDCITHIGTEAFSGCTALATITIPSKVTSIGNNSFYDCRSLTEINFNAVSMNDFTSNSHVFYDAGYSTGITVTIGKDVKKIPNYLFCPGTSTDTSSYAPNITSVVFEENSICTSIGEYAFAYCYALKNINIPNSVTSIGNGAFYSCSQLTSVTIPSSVTSIGRSAFYDCTCLTEINFNAVWARDLAAENDVFSNAGDNRTGITVTIGKDVEKIPNYLFYPGMSTGVSSYAPNIISVVFEENSICTSIGEYAFAYCYALKNINIPNSVTSIGRGAFSRCSQLTSIYIPISVTSIGDYAFDSCSSLKIYCASSRYPSGWDYYWNYSNRPVVREHTHTYENGSCVCGIKEN